jgi:hypothetical protein
MMTFLKRIRDQWADLWIEPKPVKPATSFIHPQPTTAKTPSIQSKAARPSASTTTPILATTQTNSNDPFADFCKTQVQALFDKNGILQQKDRDARFEAKLTRFFDDERQGSNAVDSSARELPKEIAVIVNAFPSAGDEKAITAWFARLEEAVNHYLPRYLALITDELEKRATKQLSMTWFNRRAQKQDAINLQESLYRAYLFWCVQCTNTQDSVYDGVSSLLRQLYSTAKLENAAVYNMPVPTMRSPAVKPRIALQQSHGEQPWTNTAEQLKQPRIIKNSASCPDFSELSNQSKPNPTPHPGFSVCYGYQSVDRVTVFAKENGALLKAFKTTFLTDWWTIPSSATNKLKDQIERFDNLNYYSKGKERLLVADLAADFAKLCNIQDAIKAWRLERDPCPEAEDTKSKPRSKRATKMDTFANHIRDVIVKLEQLSQSMDEQATTLAALVKQTDDGVWNVNQSQVKQLTAQHLAERPRQPAPPQFEAPRIPQVRTTWVR